MKFTKILALCLVALMMLAAFAACNDGNSGDETTEGTTQGTTEGTTADTTEETTEGTTDPEQPEITTITIAEARLPCKLQYFIIVLPF